MDHDANQPIQVELRWENPDARHALERWTQYTVTITRRQLGELLTTVDDLEFDQDLTPQALTTSQRCRTLHLPHCGCGRT
ncbi:hypothetical protein ACFQ1I_22340 [Kitasatospora arboriphila]